MGGAYTTGLRTGCLERRGLAGGENWRKKVFRKKQNSSPSARDKVPKRRPLCGESESCGKKESLEGGDQAGGGGKTPGGGEKNGFNVIL